MFVGPSRQLASLMFASAVAIHWYASLMWMEASRLETHGEPSWLTETHRATPWQTWPLWARYVRAFDHALRIVQGEGEAGVSHDEAWLVLLGRLGGIM